MIRLIPRRLLVSTVASLSALLAVVAATGSSHGQPASGVQLTPDEKRTLVSKNVGAERWAIARNRDDGSVTGNVFRLDGGRPQFLSCQELSRSGEDLLLRCLGADPCPLAGCDIQEWTFIAEVTVPAAFFEPPAGDAGPAATSVPGARASARPAGMVENLPSGAQPSADRRGDLVSKDVGAERWAITRNRDDGTITGNVFLPDGGEPRFVWCEETRSGEILELACFGADRCDASPCPDAWGFIADVEIPGTFFAPPAVVGLLEVVDAVEGALAEENGGVAILLALDRGYTLEQIVRAALSGRLLLSGELSTRSGDFELPDGEPFGLFGANPRAETAMVRGVPQGDEPLTPVEVLEKIQEFRNGSRERGVLAVLLALGASGYDAEQITGLILGVHAVGQCGIGPARDLPCERFEIILLTPDDDLVPPKLTPALFLEGTALPPPCADGEDDCPPEDPFPWSFTGTLTGDVTLTAEFGQAQIVTPCPMKLTLLTDGTIEGEYACPIFIQTICPDPISGAPGRFVTAGSDIVTLVTGTWSEDGSFEMDAVNTAVGTPYRGTFTATELFATRNLGRRQFTNCDLTITSTTIGTLELERDLR